VSAVSLCFLEEFLEDPVSLLVVPCSFCLLHPFALVHVGLIGFVVGLEVTFSSIASKADPI
jgi:hypothetical protein